MIWVDGGLQVNYDFAGDITLSQQLLIDESRINSGKDGAYFISSLPGISDSDNPVERISAGTVQMTMTGSGLEINLRMVNGEYKLFNFMLEEQ